MLLPGIRVALQEGKTVNRERRVADSEIGSGREVHKPEKFNCISDMQASVVLGRPLILGTKVALSSCVCVCVCVRTIAAVRLCI